MRIGLFVDAYLPEINGVVTATKTLVDAFISKGDEAFVITTNPFNNEILIQDNVIRLPGIPLKKLYGYRISAPFDRKAEKIVKQLHLDVIHVQTELSIGIFGRLMAKKYDIPLVYTYHTMYVDYTYYVTKGILDPLAKGVVKRFSKMLASISTEFTTTSEKTKNALRTYGVDQYINVIPNGIDINKFAKSKYTKEDIEKYRKEHNLEGKYLILTVGRIAKEKSLDVCIKQYANYLNKTNDKKTMFIIVGDGPQKEEYEKLAIDLKVMDRIIFVGKVSHDETSLFYNMCDL